MAYPYPFFSKYLRTWGEAGVIKTGKDGKIGDWGFMGMFVGYALNHKGDCYRMWNSNTKKVSETCDIAFLNRMFFRTHTKPEHKTQSTDNEDLNSVRQNKRGGYYNCRFCHR